MPRDEMMTTEQVLARFSAGPASGVFTDGSCYGNPGPGGWGVVRVRDGAVLAQRHGAHPSTTNNRMEFEAMIAGLEMIDPSEAEDVYSDSNPGPGGWGVVLRDGAVQTLNEWAAGWAIWWCRRSTSGRRAGSSEAGSVARARSRTSIWSSAPGRSRRSGRTPASSGSAPTTARAGTSTPTLSRRPTCAIWSEHPAFGTAIAHPIDYPRAHSPSRERDRQR